MKTGIILVPSEDEQISAVENFFQAELAPYGAEVTCVDTIGDTLSELENEISDLIKNNELIIVAGKTGVGLAVSNALSVPAVVSNRCSRRIKEYFSNIGEVLPNDATKWSLVPSGAEIINNDHGPINGFLYRTHLEKSDGTKGDNRTVVFFPSRQREFLHMFNSTMQLLKQNDDHIKAVSFGVFGLSESVLNSRLSDLLSNANPYVNIYPRNGEAWIQVVGKSVNPAELDSIMTPVTDSIKERLGINIFSVDSGSLAKVVVNSLKKRDLKISIAEDASAARLAQRLFQIPDVASVLGCAVFAADNDRKINDLGFSEDELLTYNRSGPEMTALMAHKVKKAGNSDIGFSISEIEKEKNADDDEILVMHVALADNKRVWIKRIEVPFENLGGEATFIRFHAVSYSLDLIRRYLEALPMVMAGGEALEMLPYFKAAPEAAPPPLPIEPKYNHLNKPRSLSQIFLPSRGDSGLVKLRKVSVLSLLVLLIVLFFLISNFDSFTAKTAKNNPVNNPIKLYTNSAGDAMVNMPNAPGGKILSAFTELYNRNNDVRGMIKIENTNINHIVMVGGSDFYKTNDFDKNGSSYGVPYFTQKSYENSVENDSVLSIFGNNTRDGQMFSDLEKYEDIDFLKNHTTIEMNTIYQKAVWKIFSVMIIPAPDAENSVYDYTQTVFSSETEDNKLKFISNMRTYSIYDFGEGESFTQVDDSYIFLATDYYGSSSLKNAEIVVVARKVRGGEALENNLEKTTYKPDFLVSKQLWLDKVFTLSTKSNSDTTNFASESETDSESSESSTESGSSATETTTPSGGTTLEDSSGTSSSNAADKPAATTKPATTTTTAEKPADTPNFLPIPTPNLPATVTESPALPGKESSFINSITVVGYSGAKSTKSDWQLIISMVVKKEVGHSKFHDEVLKAQAIVSYTKAIYDKNIDLSHIVFDKNSNPRDNHIYNVVGEVIGNKITYNNKVIAALCFASSAGVTLDNAKHFGSDLPYLKPVESKYDEFSDKLTNSNRFSDTKTYTYSTLMSRLGEKAKSEVKCDNDIFKVTETDPYGIYVYKTSAYIIVGGKKTYLTGKQIREFLTEEKSIDSLNSSAFTVIQTGNSVKISTLGWGHGVGFSQHGANGYAYNEGWNYKQLLAHYYSFKTSGAVINLSNW